MLIFFLFVLFVSGWIALWIELEEKSTLVDQAELEARKWLKVRDEAYDAYIGYLDEINQTFVKQMQEELNLFCSADRSVLDEKIQEMGMDFDVGRAATIAEARALLLLVIDKHLQIINAHKGIQPHLVESPFTPKQLAYSISFKDRNGIRSDGCVTLIGKTISSAPSGKIFYCREDPFISKFAHSLVEICEEPYEEAVRINEATPLQNPLTHVPTEQEVALVEAYRLFAKSIAEDYRLQCWNIGEKNVDGAFAIGCYLVARYQNEHEEARQLTISTAEKLLQIINESDSVRPFLNGSPFSSDRLKITLNFVDDDYGPRYDGSVETVILENNQISYYHRIFDEKKNKPYPTKKVLYLEETYPEASYIRPIESDCIPD